MHACNQKIMAIAIYLCLIALGLGCSSTSNQTDQYLLQHRDLPPEIILAIGNLQVINGMNPEQVLLVMGEPMLKETIAQDAVERWIYRESSSGMKLGEAYDPGSAFPLGIGFVIPLPYRAQEIRVDFNSGAVCRIERILSF